MWLPAQRRQGDVAGLGLLGAGVAIYITELGRDTEGRGTLLNGALDGPQAAAILFVLAGALVLMERKPSGAQVERTRPAANVERDEPSPENEANIG